MPIVRGRRFPYSSKGLKKAGKAEMKDESAPALDMGQAHQEIKKLLMKRRIKNTMK